ncbi:MAG TPA: D-sedoheptulose 7-phosphate isomerase [Candidatus Deferrimicrobiaceae bacterium]|jgi:D-sedoheptulose 7-phosphate isomerase
MRETIVKALRDGADLKQRMADTMAAEIEEAARTIADAIRAGNKLLLFGNGGSAADAQHVAAEFVNRFLVERPPLAAIALTTDSSVVTSIANDYSFDELFSKQVRALGKPGDVALGISTSGSSRNVVAAFAAAKAIGMKTIALTREGGAMAIGADVALAVPSSFTPRIQEGHIAILHIVCELVDLILFPDARRG